MPKITVYGGASFWEGVPGPGTASTPQEDVQEPDTGLLDEPTGKPAVNDPKAAWVDYAVSQGWLRDDAEAVTKQQLITQFKD
jgi:hypothetical protein